MESSAVTRRGFLAGAAGAAALVGLGRTGWQDLLARAAVTAPAGSGLEAIEHVVIVMQENRSFDHYFGVYPGVRGFDDHRGATLGPFSQPTLGALSPDGPAHVLPFRLDVGTKTPMCAGNAAVPIHNWLPQHQSWARGKMNRFVATHAQPENDGPSQGALVMGYFIRDDLPFYYGLADQFTLCDAYHCSVIGPTMPNRLYALSGMLDPDGKAGGPVLSTPNSYQATTAVGSVRWETMFERLQDAGVSWKCYQTPGTSVGQDEHLNLAIGFNALLYFEQYLADPDSELYRRAFLPVWPTEFQSDVANGTLPQVSWMVPTIVDSEHPSAAPINGERFVAQILETLVGNPDVWAKTVVFIVYDENGGFFDHVTPPTPPKGTPGEEITVSPLPAAAGGVAGPIGLGFRVPALVVSPFSRGGRVESDVFDHTSLLRFLETRFGVNAPNLTAWRRKTVGDLTSTLDLGHADPSVPKLPPAPTISTQLGEECLTVTNEVALLDAPPTLDLPDPQSMPKQERKR